MRKRTLLIVFAAAGFIGAQEKVTKPNFSGSWVIISSSDESGTSGTDTPLMVVEHREPQLKLAIGSNVWLLSTDGKENVNRIGETEVRSLTHWEGDRLITEWMTQVDGKAVPHRQAWSRAKDGKRLTLEMKDGDHETTVTAMKR
jgi:hypothetical protein